MSLAKDKLMDDIEKLTDEQRESCLQFLVGFNLSAASTAVAWVKETYPA